MQEISLDSPSDTQLQAVSLVGAWIKAVEGSSREDLIHATEGWTDIHSELLTKELERQIEGTSVLAIGLSRVSPERILNSIFLINEAKSSPILAAMVAGFSLI